MALTPCVFTFHDKIKYPEYDKIAQQYQDIKELDYQNNQLLDLDSKLLEAPDSKSVMIGPEPERIATVKQDLHHYHHIGEARGYHYWKQFKIDRDRGVKTSADFKPYDFAMLKKILLAFFASYVLLNWMKLKA